MFGNQAIGVLPSFFRAGRACALAVLPSATDVAQKAATFGSYHGRSRNFCLNPHHPAPATPTNRVDAVSRGRGFHTFAFLRETIPGADFQAIVTAKDPVADQRSHFHGDGTLYSMVQ